MQTPKKPDAMRPKARHPWHGRAQAAVRRKDVYHNVNKFEEIDKDRSTETLFEEIES